MPDYSPSTNALEHFPKSGNRFLDKKCTTNNKPEHLAEQSETKNALEVKGIWKVFGTNVRHFKQIAATDRTAEKLAEAGMIGAVQNASFSIRQGEVFVIMGLSGSGKSTLLRCLTRLIEPTEGKIYYHGENILDLNERALQEMRRQKMGMVFQHFALLPNRNVLGNVAFPLEIRGMARDEAFARAHELIVMVGLDGRETRFPMELSGGQQQRVGIARSLATNPEFWFLDEPFSALDPLIRADLQLEVQRIQKSQTRSVIFVTHDLDEAILLADRIAIMEAGCIIQIGTPEELVTRPATDYVRRFVAKIAPARVVRVTSLMQPVIDGTATSGVHANATLAEIGADLISGNEIIPVINDQGRQIGILNRGHALATFINPT